MRIEKIPRMPAQPTYEFSNVSYMELEILSIGVAKVIENASSIAQVRVAKEIQTTMFEAKKK